MRRDVKLCPKEIAQTRQLSLSGQDSAVQLRIETGAEICEGIPNCKGPVEVEVERNRIAAVFLGRYTTEEVCSRQLNTVQS